MTCTRRLLAFPLLILRRVVRRRTLLLAAYLAAGVFWSAPARAQQSTFLYPPNGAVNVDSTKPFSWTDVPGAEFYRLYVGTSPGGRDLIDTGAVQMLSRAIGGVPERQILYARIWTSLNGALLSSDIVFMVGVQSSLSVARFTYPANDAVNADPTKPFTWTGVPAGQGYRLWVGTTQGSKSVLDSGAITQTSYAAAVLPSGRTLYARIWTNLNGAWLYSEIRFTAAEASAIPPSRSSIRRAATGPRRTVFRSPTPIAATFVYPTNGAADVDPANPFDWTDVAGAQAYHLIVGTVSGGSDVLDSGEISQSSYPMTGLPAGPTLYATVWTKVNGAWSSSAIQFTASPAPAPPEPVVPASPIAIVYPEAGVSMDLGLPFEWSLSSQADSYRLQIGTQPGGSELDDSGEIRVNRRFVRGLPTGTNLFARVSARVSGSWIPLDFSFLVAGETGSLGHRIDSALWATDFVRQMAGTNNLPLPATELAAVTDGAAAFCNDYAQALQNILVAMNAGLPTRVQNVCMNTNFYDCHTLLEASPDGGITWMLLDPTFDITMKRASDGAWAQASDLSAATRTFAWGAIDYVLLGPERDAFLKNYYIDYPLLYLNVYGGAPITLGEGLSPLPYLQPVAFPVQNKPGVYVLRSESLPHVEVSIDGLDTDVPFDGSDFLSHAFGATTIGPGPGIDPSTLRAYVPLRFVF